jgi:hypothetical protein
LAGKFFAWQQKSRGCFFAPPRDSFGTLEKYLEDRIKVVYTENDIPDEFWRQKFFDARCFYRRVIISGVRAVSSIWD